MVLSFYILGVYNMANGLEHIAKILKELNEELKLDNDKWERANVTATTLRPSNDGTTPTRRTEHFKISNRRKTDEL
jgi:hypothetical protein